jgi:hypothetical protein
VLPHPDAETLDWVNCGMEPQSMSAYPLYVAGATGFCDGCNQHMEPDWYPGTPVAFDCEPLPTEPSTWGRIKALYRS